MKQPSIDLSSLALNAPISTMELEKMANSHPPAAQALLDAKEAAAFAKENDLVEYIGGDLPHVPGRPDNRRRSNGKLLVGSLLGMAAGMGMDFSGFFPGPSASAIRHNPERPKTEADLAAMEAAKVRQERKKAKREKRTS